MNTFGRMLRVSLFGESHGPGVGVLLDGVPPGLPVNVDLLQADLDLRRPGASRLTSQRKEPDVPTLLSGVHAGHSTGAPLCVWIANEDADGKPYAKLGGIARPGHADWPSHVASLGHRDPRGGGHDSGRLTAGLVAAGSIAQQILAPLGVTCAAQLHQVGDIIAPLGKHPAAAMATAVARSPLRTAHTSFAPKFTAAIEAARKAQDSIGGAIEFRADGLPIGVGAPWMAGVEPHLGQLLLAVPAVKGVEFGAGFAAAALRGSAHNDALTAKGGRVASRTNHAGGVLGGRTTGAPLTGRVAVKPASSIAQEQDSVHLGSGKATKVRVTGRHDPCIAIRAVPVVQACLRLALADLVLEARTRGLPGV